MDRIADSAGHVLHSRGKVLLEVDGVVEGPVLRVDLLLLGKELLLYRSREKLVRVLLRMNLEQRRRIDLPQQCILGLLGRIGRKSVRFEVRQFGCECLRVRPDRAERGQRAGGGCLRQL